MKPRDLFSTGDPVEFLPLLVASVGVFFITSLIISIPIAWQAETDSVVVSAAAVLVILAEILLFLRGWV